MALKLFLLIIACKSFNSFPLKIHSQLFSNLITYLNPLKTNKKKIPLKIKFENHVPLLGWFSTVTWKLLFHTSCTTHHHAFGFFGVFPTFPIKLVEQLYHKLEPFAWIYNLSFCKSWVFCSTIVWKVFPFIIWENVHEIDVNKVFWALFYFQWGSHLYHLSISLGNPFIGINLWGRHVCFLLLKKHFSCYYVVSWIINHPK